MCSCRKSPSPGALSIRTRMPSFTVVLKPTARRSVLVLGLSFAGQVYRMRPPLFPKIYVAPAAKKEGGISSLGFLPAMIALFSLHRGIYETARISLVNDEIQGLLGYCHPKLKCEQKELTTEEMLWK